MTIIQTKSVLKLTETVLFDKKIQNVKSMTWSGLLGYYQRQ